MIDLKKTTQSNHVVEYELCLIVRSVWMNMDIAFLRIKFSSSNWRFFLKLLNLTSYEDRIVINFSFRICAREDKAIPYSANEFCDFPPL